MLHQSRTLGVADQLNGQAFPVRLAQELFLRCVSYLPASEPLTLWDPCCGSGYLAVVTSLLDRPGLGRLVCSDVSPDAVALAFRNLALLVNPTSTRCTEAS
jgi:23S rRNA (guanine2535-N1)-methyltransferase